MGSVVYPHCGSEGLALHTGGNGSSGGVGVGFGSSVMFHRKYPFVGQTRCMSIATLADHVPNIHMSLKTPRMVYPPAGSGFTATFAP